MTGADFEVGDDLIVTMDDCIKAGYCPSGVRGWFREQGLDFRAHLASGTPAKAMLATGNGHAVAVVKRAIERRLVGVDLTGLVITLDDARGASKCSEGMQQFAARTGLDWRQFVRDGISATALVATGDPEALEVVRQAVRSRAHG
jgi:hypothetical protein